MSNDKTRAAAEGALSESTMAAAEARKALGIQSGDMQSAAAMLANEVDETRTRLRLSSSQAAKQMDVDGRALKIFMQRGNTKPKHLRRIAAWVRDNRPVEEFGDDLDPVD